MFLSNEWKDYAILDAGGGEKLERWGSVKLLRPDPQAAWPMRADVSQADAHYIRANTGGGHWEYGRSLSESWHIQYKDLRFFVRPTGFKHTGLFPEQAANWDFMRAIVEDAAPTPEKPFRALNLFAYTGAATCALAASGASVVHVDAAKGMVSWAKDNLASCELSSRPVRFLVDDAMKFVQREARRGNLYDGILMDPPSYGRGPGGEMWKIENDLYPLVEACVHILSPEARFFLINSYTTGLAPSVISNVLKVALKGRGGHVEVDELGLPIERDSLVLPCGATGRWTR